MTRARILLRSMLLAAAIVIPSASSLTQAAAPPVKKPSPVADAQAEVNRCQVNLNKVRASIKSSVEQKDEWKASAGALQRAQAEYNAAKKPVLDALQQKPEYKALLERKKKADDRIAELVKEPQPKDEEMQAAQKESGQAVIALKEMEKEALASDEKVADASSKLADANKQEAALNAAVDAACGSDKDYQQAQKQLEAAEERLKTARASVPKPPKPADPPKHTSSGSRSTRSRTSGY